MKKQFLFFLSGIFISGFVNAQEVITSWTFDNGLQFPATGTGTLSLAGSVIVDFTKTGINQGLSLPAGLEETDELKTGKSCNSYNYPAQGTNSKSAGLQFKVSTAGYKNILVSADVRQGGTSANKLMLQYTVDGSTWEKAITYTTDDNDTWYLRNFNFKNVPGVNNNPLFAIRFVTNFDDDIIGQSVYVPVSASNVYSPSGSIRYDNVIIRGEKQNTPEDDRTVFSEFDFDNQQLMPSIGKGSIALTGGISYDAVWTKSGIFKNQTIFDQGVYDYASVKDSFGLQTFDYPAIGNDKSAGIQVFVNTTNYKEILFSADVRHGGTSANAMTLQYTTDGTNWMDATSYTANSGDTWYRRAFDFSTIPAVSNNPQFGFRLVTAMLGLSYQPTTFGKIYATTGPIRFDNLVLKGRIITGLTSTESTPDFIQRGSLIEFTQNVNVVRVYNLSGVVVMERTQTNQVDLSHLPGGIYIMDTIHSRHKIILH